MQVGVDIICMYTNFGGCGLSDFGDSIAFKLGQFSLSDHGPCFYFHYFVSMVVKKLNSIESAHKIHASRG